MSNNAYTPDELDAAAHAIYGDDPNWGFVVVFQYGEQALGWGELEDEARDMFRKFASRALTAARNARKGD